MWRLRALHKKRKQALAASCGPEDVSGVADEPRTKSSARQGASAATPQQPAMRLYRSHNKIMPNILEILRCFKFAKPMKDKHKCHSRAVRAAIRLAGGGRPAGPAVLCHP